MGSLFHENKHKKHLKKKSDILKITPIQIEIYLYQMKNTLFVLPLSEITPKPYTKYCIIFMCYFWRCIVMH